MAEGAVLVVGDRSDSSKRLASMLNEAGFDVTTVSDETNALELVGKADFEVAVVHFVSPDGSDMGIVRGIRRVSPDTEMILCTAHPTVRSAIEGIRERAYDYVCLPDELDRLPVTAQRAVEWGRSKVRRPRENGGISPSTGYEAVAAPTLERPSADEEFCSSVLIGETPSMAKARRLIAEVAPSCMTVLVNGESGTGKDVVARLVHEISDRKNTGGFVKINCPAIPESLFESELFGYEKGAFTGAVTQKPGRFELAERGTVFLDEIGSVSLGMQAKLLEVIEHKEFMRVGGKATISVDARIVAASNLCLEDMIAEGSFRADLFYRLKQFTISLPPLRERAEDIPLLSQHFLNVYGAKYGLSDTVLPPHIMPRLIAYEWPGNVRELKAVIARFALSGDLSALEHGIGAAPARPTRAADEKSAVDKLQEAEAAAILAALTETRWNRRKAAVKLGISYSALRRRMAKYDLNSSGVPAGGTTP